MPPPLSAPAASAWDFHPVSDRQAAAAAAYTQASSRPTQDTFLMALSGAAAAPPVPPSRMMSDVWVPTACSSHEGQLPDGWTAVVDAETGGTYYWHTASGVTQWEHPGEYYGDAPHHLRDQHRPGASPQRRAADVPGAVDPRRQASGAPGASAAGDRGAMEARLQELVEGQRALLQEISVARAQASSSAAELAAWRQRLQHMQVPHDVQRGHAYAPAQSGGEHVGGALPWTSASVGRGVSQMPAASMPPPSKLGHDRSSRGLGASSSTGQMLAHALAC